MDETSQLSEFGKIFIYLIMGVLIVLFIFFLGKLVAPKNPNHEKLTSYECGEEPTGNSWIQFNSRFYVIALVFLLFDVELAFIFPWATVFSRQELINVDPNWGWLSLPISPSKIPSSAYDAINKEVYQTKTLTINNMIPVPDKSLLNPTVSSGRPAFIPKFKKPTL
jgi:NADH-quinone oxidoreductase subunit A